MNRKLVSVMIPLGAVLVCSLLVFTNLDNKIADRFQRVMKSTAESPSLILINVDDETVKQAGTYPLSRDIYAKSLVALKDLEADQVVFDISFTDKGLARIDERYVNEDLTSFIQNSFDQLNAGNEDSETAMNDILSSVSRVISNSDEILAGSMKFFDRSFLTLTFGTEDEPSDEVNALLSSSVALKNVHGEKDTKTPEVSTLTPAYADFLKNSAGAGSVNAKPDSDGYLRRIQLFHKYNGQYYGQLILVPLLQRLGNPEIQITDSRIKLVNADLGNGTVKDIVIPRAQDGSVLLKYPKKQYNDYRLISLWSIYRLSLLEDSFTSLVSEMDDSGFFTLWDGENPADAMNAFKYLRDELYNGEDSENGITCADYSAYRQQFWSLMKQYLSQENEDSIMNSELDEESKEYIKETFENARSLLSEYETSFERVQQKVKGTTGIVGAIATSSTDSGLNQYEDKYPNVGAHYVLANQILSQDFTDDTNPLIGIVVALVLCLAFSGISSKIRGTGHQIVFGVSMIAGTVVVLLAVFAFSRKYVGTAVPFTSLLITFIVTTIRGFITASKDKKFITNAFGQCLSPEVVKEIVANPSSFKLGGEKVEMTAIFTDIQKFSSFSELLTASQLVALLNYYLTKMSDIIMKERGTVDKYEGDAIIALVGAPVKMEDHAARAVRAALEMKAAEGLMNEEIQKIAAAAKPADMSEELYSAFQIMVKNGKKLFTRIGLNSGEMIAGYMGSENKKNYTMMGNNVNLASRLEGVNKQYSTGGILMSEATRNLLGDEFIVRRLDKVRVVNVNTPLRLYEPVGLKDDKSNNLTTYVTKWERAMNLFEGAEYEAALAAFKSLSEEKPEDKVASYYISLIEKFFAKGTYPKESDNFGVEYIPEDKVFRLLQK